MCGSTLKPTLMFALGITTSLCAGLLLASLPQHTADASEQPAFDLLTLASAAAATPTVDAAPLEARRGVIEPAITAADASTAAAQARSLIIDTEPACRNRTAQVLYDVGFRGAALRTAWAIVMRESGGRPDAISATGDYGIFQINRRTYGSERWWSDKAMLDREYNAKIAFALSDGGRTFYPWDIDGGRAHLGRYSSSGVYRVFVAWLPKFPCNDLLTDTAKDPVVDSAGTVETELEVQVWPPEPAVDGTPA